MGRLELIFRFRSNRRRRPVLLTWISETQRAVRRIRELETSQPRRARADIFAKREYLKSAAEHFRMQ